MNTRDTAPEFGKTEPENGNAKRVRSTISFPYIAMGSCLEVAEAMHEIGGDACEWNQIAAHMKVAAQGGAFRQKMLATKTFGIIEYSGQDVQLTKLGQHCIDERTSKGARVDAFLRVPLFAALFGRFDGVKLPPHAAIQRTMQELGVAPKQTAKARQSFIRSAREAGFFDLNPDRLTKPPVDQDDNDPDDPPKKKKTNGGGDEPPPNSPLITALLAQMPPPKDGWPKEQCLVWLRTLLLSISMIYSTSFEELQGIEVTLRKDDQV